MCSWQRDFLAHLTIDGASNGPTEAVNLTIGIRFAAAESAGITGDATGQNPPSTLRGVEHHYECDQAVKQLDDTHHYAARMPVECLRKILGGADN